MTEKQARVAVTVVAFVVLLGAAKLYRDAHRYSYPQPSRRVDNYTGQVCEHRGIDGWVDAYNVQERRDTTLVALTDSALQRKRERYRRLLSMDSDAGHDVSSMPTVEDYDPGPLDTIISGAHSEPVPCQNGGRR